MLYQPTIAKSPPTDPAFDWQQLYQIGLAEVQSLTGNVWTDYNVHDPGVTTLELLCYALTEVSYRAQFPIPDLLATPVDNPAAMARQFFTARQILPSRPLTELDYRKLMLDVPGVENAWLSPTPLTFYADTIAGALARTNSGLPGVIPVDLGGLYDVTVEFTADVAPAGKPAVLAAVQAGLQSNRNLCEDFVNFQEVATEDFLICGELALTAQADEARVMAEIIYAVDQYLAPAVPRYTLPQMLARPNPDGSARTPDQVFEGPALANGFIDDDELARAALRQNIHLSEVIALIMEMEGVQAVKTLLINAVPATLPPPHLLPTAGTLPPTLPALQPFTPTPPLKDKWTIPVLPGRKARLKADPLRGDLPRLILYKRDMPVTPSPDLVKQAWLNLTQPATATATAPPPTDLPIPLGTWRDPGAYFSFQNHFPTIYGLSDLGPKSGTTLAQQTAMRQFKGYLLFFDQVMADGLAQLEHLRDLFSTDPTGSRTYFTQLVDSFRDYVTLYRSGFGSGDFLPDPLPVLAARLTGGSDPVTLYLRPLLSAATTQNLADYVKSPAQIPPDLIANLSLDFNRFVAGISIYNTQRFAGVTLSPETADLLAQVNSGTLPAGGTGLLNRLLLEDAFPGCFRTWRSESRAGFLDRRNRFLDHLIARYAESFADLAGITNSAFPQDAASLIAIKCHFLQTYATISRDRGLAYNRTLTDPDNSWNTGNVSGLEKRLAKLLGIPNDTRRNLAALAPPAPVAQPATSASVPLTGPSIAPPVVRPVAPPVAPAVSPPTTPPSAPPGPTAPATALDSSGEGMYLLEAILLRPNAPSDPFIPICPDPDCTDCADHDPYSFRIHIILPADVGRFVNMDFRRFAESVIRSEVPAHILPRICWVSEADMASFQAAYRAWLTASAPAPIGPVTPVSVAVPPATPPIPPGPAPTASATVSPSPTVTGNAASPTPATNPAATAATSASPVAPAGPTPDPQAVRLTALQALIATLGRMQNQYPQQKLETCGGDNSLPKFILGRTALGSMPGTPP